MSTSILTAVPREPLGAPVGDPREIRRAAPAKGVSAAAKASSGVNGDLITLLLSWAAPLALTAWFWSYYSHSLAVRLRHPQHWLLKPSGPVGLFLGVVGLALFLFLWLYPFRKKIKWLAWTGRLGAWMRVHTISGLAIPVIVAVHAGWHFHGLIGMGYWSMVMVSVSGAVGRYLYIRIPRSREGLELTLEEVGAERRTLLAEIAAVSGLEPEEIERRLGVDAKPYAGLNPLRTVLRMFQDDIARLRGLRELQRMLAQPNANQSQLRGHELHQTMRLAKRELKLSQQVRMLDATRKVFGYWHVAHRPFAITALVAVTLHIVVAVFIGGVGFPVGH